ncbi:MAG: M1 family metallopeptidase [Robiginitalea sp.]|uniref:M1 family metallopeptidase n=1 Tax=Robiginitalea sp. TaxID=1902411 RepID=UPI003C746FB4
MLLEKFISKHFLTLVFAGFWSLTSLAQNTLPDFQSAEIYIHPDPYTETITGEVRYRFKTTSGIDSVVLNAHNMKFEHVILNGQPVAYQIHNGLLSIQGPKKKGTHKLHISYKAFPKQTVYFVGWKDDIGGNEQIWTQGQGKNSSHWVPVVDDMQEKMVFDLSIRMDSTYEVISNGVLRRKAIEDRLRLWEFDMERPMSSYLLAFAIGEYRNLDRQAASGVPLKLYYPQGQEHRAHWTYLYTEEIFDFLESEIGIPYPWKDYKQVPVSDFLYAGMENTGATFFSDRYLVDSLGYNDENYVNINAHELAHQWFGNLVTEKDAAHHWLHEGFATFYAYRAEQALFGPEYVHWKLYETARVLEEMDQNGSGEALTDPGAGSLTFYEKGAWALFILREELGGEVFDRGVRLFLKNKAYSNAQIFDFLKAMETESGTSLSEYRRTWLESEDFEIAAALEYLSKKEPDIATFISAYEDIKKRILPNEKGFNTYWEMGSSPEYKAHIIEAVGPLISRELWEEAARSQVLIVHKALLEHTSETRDWMKPYLNDWLDAPSYVVRENSLFRLWMNDPGNRSAPLDRIAANGSLDNLRLKQLWWLLAMLTPEYKSQDQQRIYLEALRKTTAPGNSWEIRQNGLAMLQQVGALNLQNVEDLMQATEHHSWQFRKFSREMLEDVMAQTPGAANWEELARQFPKEKYKYLHELIATL